MGTSYIVEYPPLKCRSTTEMNKMEIKLTEMEKEIIEFVATSDHASDGHGLTGWIADYDFDMVVYRGVLSSLVKKGVVDVDNSDHDLNGSWVSICSKYQMHDESIDNEYGGWVLVGLGVE